MKTGEDLIAAGHFSSDSIRERINEINAMLNNLSRLQQQRMKRLTDAVDYHQVSKPSFKIWFKSFWIKLV